MGRNLPELAEVVRGELGIDAGSWRTLSW